MTYQVDYIDRDEKTKTTVVKVQREEFIPVAVKAQDRKFSSVKKIKAVV